MSTISHRGALRKSDLREANQRLLLNIIRQNGGCSRADIVRITGFSASSVTYVVNRMMRDGLVAELAGEPSSQVGRRPVMLRLRPEALIAAGVEIGRNGARVVTADLNGVFLKQRAVRWHPDHQIFLARVREALRALTETIEEGRRLGVGVGVSGTIDRATGRVIAAENLGWTDVDVGRVLSEGVPAPVYFENDAKLRALAERWFCEPGSQPLENFVFLALRHGLGSGVVIEGRLFHGASGEASEFGHTSLFPDGRRCVCGGIGCWEEYASQRALERLYRERLGTGCEAEGPDAEEIVRLARSGDPIASDVLRQAATYLGMGFANLNAAFNPEAIVVGDYVASGWDLMKDWIWETLRSRAPQRHLTRLRILPSRHGHDSTLKGAVALVLSHLFAETGQKKSGGAFRRSTKSRHPVRLPRVAS